MKLGETADEIEMVNSVRGRVLPNWARIVLVAIVLLSAVSAFFAFDLDSYLSLQTLESNRAWLLDQVASHPVATVIAFIVVYALVVAASVPGAAILSVSSGFLFGTVFGTAYTVTGATLGAIGLLLFVRAGLGDALTARAGTSIDRFRRGFQENAFGYLLFMRLLPIFPFFIVNLAAAVLGVRLRTFTLATAFGIVPGSTVFASFGSGLGSLLDEQGDIDLGTILTPEIVLPLVGLAALSLAPALYKAITHRRKGGQA